MNVLFKEAHSDCTLARLNNYPKSKLVKVLWRKASCAVKMEDLKELTLATTEMMMLLNELGIQHLHVDMSRYTVSLTLATG